MTIFLAALTILTLTPYATHATPTANTRTPATCDAGHYRLLGVCARCPTGCLTCTSASECLTCDDGYRYTAPTCTRCLDINCMRCDYGSCTSCMPGYAIVKVMYLPSLCAVSDNHARTDRINKVALISMCVFMSLTACCLLDDAVKRGIRRFRANQNDAREALIDRRH